MVHDTPPKPKASCSAENEHKKTQEREEASIPSAQACPDRSDTPMPLCSLRVAVIGAGAAGLVAARELRREGHAPMVFERTDGVGGTWVYEDDADADAPASPDARRRSNLY